MRPTSEDHDKSGSRSDAEHSDHATNPSPAMAPSPATPPAPARAPAPAPAAEPAWRPPRSDSGRNAGFVFGVILVVIGLWFFATTTLGLDLPRVDWAALWPLLLIGSVPGSCSERSAVDGDDRT